MNQVIEIPDTPDRLVATKHNKDRNTIVGRSDGSINKQRMPTKISIIFNGIKRIIGSPTGFNESPVLKYFRKTKPTIDIDRYDKGALANTEVIKSTHKVNGYGQSEKGVLPVANLPAIVSLDGSSKSSKVENIPKPGPTVDRGKSVDVVAENNTQPSTLSKVYQRKKLVPNECVSPPDIEKSKKVVVKCENPNVVKQVTSGSGTVASDGRSSIVDIEDLVAEDKDSRRHKGKGISYQFSFEEANAGNPHLSQRERIHKDPAESITDFGVDANGWRTTHNNWKQRDNKQQKNEIMETDHKNEADIKHLVDLAKTSSPVCDLPNANESGINRQTESSTSRNRGKRPISCIEDSAGQPSTSTPKRKQRDIRQQKTDTIQRDHNNVIEIIDLEDSPTASSRVRDIPNADELGINRQIESSTSRNRGKRPISCIEDSVGQPSTSRPKQNENLSGPRPKRNKNLSGPSTSNPVSEPNIQIHGNNEDLSVRALQIEDDEILALQLQQQLYNEEPLYNHQDNHLPSAGVLHAPHRRGRPRSNPSDMRMLNEILQVGREFNENDYEMLSALDEDNYKHQGATREQINSLPESTVQTENSQECTICLESPTIGEKIRHLPCLHKFHKACVDEWLLRRRSCPVCKTWT
ncbi:Zinc finger, RING/FYVE/PHD-type [Artemisia annua]|uniref:Zinc finger, RING/FYVE/PHD-type n=1 Tax=Artemisia annua TaxID=35608 RepID=A0A2U1KG96_ARTAN|nr:Zinc finger, RING/FYVE/PHD-type [Artemisia annua]